MVLTGAFDGTVDFGGGSLTSAGAQDIFVASYDSTGAHRFSKRFGGQSQDQGSGVAVDGSGNVVVTGHFIGAVDVGGGPLAYAAGWDIFVAGYDPTGTHRFSKGFGSAVIDDGLGVAMDGSGNVALTGSFQQTMDFDGAQLVSASGHDIFLIQLIQPSL